VSYLYSSEISLTPSSWVKARAALRIMERWFQTKTGRMSGETARIQARVGSTSQK